jgi:hypothetical protein
MPLTGTACRGRGGVYSMRLLSLVSKMIIVLNQINHQHDVVRLDL